VAAARPKHAKLLKDIRRLLRMRGGAGGAGGVSREPSAESTEEGGGGGGGDGGGGGGGGGGRLGGIDKILMEALEEEVSVLRARVAELESELMAPWAAGPPPTTVRAPSLRALRLPGGPRPTALPC
jgi:hypothetical protein